MNQPRVQRRLAAILATDVVGYSRLMGDDEAGTLARLKKLRGDFIHPKVSEYGGRIVKTTGDGTLVEFPSAVDALQHAVDVQLELSRRNADLSEAERLEFRMGINLGDIIVDGDDDDIFGDGVNVAARLEGLADPGGICISAIVRESVRNKLDIELSDLGEQPLKNIAEPVHVYRVVMDGSAGTADNASGSDAMFRRPAVAVLPFENISGDPEQEYFTDGLTEDIITALSLWRSFPVIARNSTFAYKGQSPDIRVVGKELGARYVIEGSVRKAGMRVRVTAQLINSENGHHIWAERFDRNLDDIFDLQDELSQQIAAAIAPELEFAPAPRTKSKTPQNLDAWELVQRGHAKSFPLDHESVLAARRDFERAIELDPDYARAYSGLAFTYHRELWLGYADFSGDTRDRFLEAANRAVSLDETDSSGHAILTMACFWCHENDRGLAEAKRAVDLNPNNAHAQHILGTAFTLLGRPMEGIPHQERAMVLSPRDPRHGIWMWGTGMGHLTAHQYDEAEEWSQQAIQRHSANPDAHLVLASSLGHLGRVEEARDALATYGRLLPQKAEQPSIVWRYKHDADEQHLLDGLRKAGWQG